jgi:hypothetical protein
MRENRRFVRVRPTGLVSRVGKIIINPKTPTIDCNMLPAEVARQMASENKRCRVTMQMVPTERGGMSQVRITRCYAADE